jgi:hypothetical protein
VVRGNIAATSLEIKVRPLNPIWKNKTPVKLGWLDQTAVNINTFVKKAFGSTNSTPSVTVPQFNPLVIMNSTDMPQGLIFETSASALTDTIKSAANRIITDALEKNIIISIGNETNVEFNNVPKLIKDCMIPDDPNYHSTLADATVCSEIFKGIANNLELKLKTISRSVDSRSDQNLKKQINFIDPLAPLSISASKDGDLGQVNPDNDQLLKDYAKHVSAYMMSRKLQTYFNSLIGISYEIREADSITPQQHAAYQSRSDALLASDPSFLIYSNLLNAAEIGVFDAYKAMATIRQYDARFRDATRSAAPRPSLDNNYALMGVMFAGLSVAAVGALVMMPGVSKGIGSVSEATGELLGSSIKLVTIPIKLLTEVGNLGVSGGEWVLESIKRRREKRQNAHEEKILARKETAKLISLNQTNLKVISNEVLAIFEKMTRIIREIEKKNLNIQSKIENDTPFGNDEDENSYIREIMDFFGNNKSELGYCNRNFDDKIRILKQFKEGKLSDPETSNTIDGYIKAQTDYYNTRKETFENANNYIYDSISKLTTKLTDIKAEKQTLLAIKLQIESVAPFLEKPTLTDYEKSTILKINSELKNYPMFIDKQDKNYSYMKSDREAIQKFVHDKLTPKTSWFSKPPAAANDPVSSPPPVPISPPPPPDAAPTTDDSSLPQPPSSAANAPPTEGDRSTTRILKQMSSSWVPVPDDTEYSDPPKTQSTPLKKALSNIGYTGTKKFPFVKPSTQSFPGGSRRRLLSGKRRATRGGKKANVNRTKKHPRQKKRRTNTRRKRS